MHKQSETGFIGEYDFAPVLSSPFTILSAEDQSVPDVFLWREVASFLPFLTPGHLPKVFASPCVQMRSHLPAAIPEQALHWWHSDPAAESSLGDNPGACWTFLDALKPS